MTFKKGQLVRSRVTGNIYTVIQHVGIRVEVLSVNNENEEAFFMVDHHLEVFDSDANKCDLLDEYKIVMESIGEHMTATVVMNGKVQARGVPVITKEWYESQHGELK